MQEHAVALGLIAAPGQGDIARILRAQRIVMPHVHRDADLCARQVIRAEQLHRLAVAQQQMVQALAGVFFVLQTGRKEALRIAHIYRNRLVKGDP